MDSDDPPSACAACLLLGNGAYGLNDQDGKSHCPILIFGGDPNQSVKAIHGLTLDEILANRKPQIAAALESFLIGSIGERHLFAEAKDRMTPADAAEYARLRHDQLRSSMNNIGERAQELAARLREHLAETTA